MCKKTPQELQILLYPAESKFGDHCAYKHNSSSDKSENKKYLDKIIALEDSVEFRKAQICDLTEEVDNIKSKKHKVRDDLSLKRDICEYKASTKSVLKRHTTT